MHPITIIGSGLANDLEDYTRFRAALQDAKPIMDAGLIGCEFANDLQPACFSVCQLLS